MNTPAIALLIVTISVPMPVETLVAQAETASSAYVWDFDRERPGTLPGDFSIQTLFDGRPAGEWRVVATDRAKSPPHVLAQLMAKGAEHAYKMLLVKGVIAADLDLRVSFLPIHGQADMGGGLTWRAADDRNYYLVRANPLEQNIRIYRVVKGVRHLLQNFDQTIDVRRWHRLQIIHRERHLRVFYDERQVFDLNEDTFLTGQIGIWTKSDAVTYFDDLYLQRLK
jgi:hypothetical protein